MQLCPLLKLSKLACDPLLLLLNRPQRCVRLSLLRLSLLGVFLNDTLLLLLDTLQAGESESVFRLLLRNRSAE